MISVFVLLFSFSTKQVIITVVLVIDRFSNQSQEEENNEPKILIPVSIVLQVFFFFRNQID
jgi:hypothetical protein